VIRVERKPGTGKTAVGASSRPKLTLISTLTISICALSICRAVPVSGNPVLHSFPRPAIRFTSPTDPITPSNTSVVPGTEAQVIDGVRISDSCPAGADATDASGASFTPAQLEATQRGVEAYGAVQSTFAGSTIRYQQRNVSAPSGVVVAAFTDEDLAPHASALAKAEGAGIGLVVCHGPFSLAEAIGIEQELRSTPGIRSVLRDADVLAVSLSSNQLALAKKLRAKYRSAVMVLVGRLLFPNASLPPASLNQPACPMFTAPPPLANGFDQKLRWGGPRSVTTGRIVSSPPIATITLSSTSRTPVALPVETPMHTYIFRATTNEVVAFSSGVIRTSATDTQVIGTRTVSFRVPVNIDSCSPGLGFTLPKGKYVLLVSFSIPKVVGDGPNEELLAPPIALTIKA
jgi:hypothetical protein